MLPSEAVIACRMAGYASIRALKFGAYCSIRSFSGISCWLFTPYSRTQHYGNRTGTSWVSLTSDDGKTTVTVRSENNVNGMEFTASPWTQKEIRDARTPDRLPPSERTVLELDIFQAPLGGNSCGPVPLEKYTVRAGRETSFKLDYTIIPII